LTMGQQREEAIANMEAMGFDRQQIEACMRAAFFNPDRAVEYLLNVGLHRQCHFLTRRNC
jgi:UV excision repair protein RAD23